MIHEYRFQPRVLLRLCEDEEWQAICVDFEGTSIKCNDEMMALDLCLLMIAEKVVRDELFYSKAEYLLDWAAGYPVPYTNSFDITSHGKRWRVEGLDVRKPENG